MVSLWHAFDLAASLASGESRAEAPRAAASRARPLAPWLRAALLTPEEAREHEAAWRDLASRALIPNIFGEPEMALAAATHLLQGQTARFLFVWDERAHPAPRLILSAPLILPVLAVGEARLWSHEQLASSVPLIDRDEADAAMEALLEAMRQGPAKATGLMLSRVDERSVFADLVRKSVRRSGREILRFERPSRTPPGTFPERETPAGLRSTVARSSRRVREAVEHYLAIEALGSAGESGEALLFSPQASAFLRVVTRSLARQKRCHVELRHAQGKPVGADIHLRFGDTDLLWKSAGVGASTPEIPKAVSDEATVDWLIAARPGRSPAILALAARDALSRGLRQLVRRAVRRPGA
jgi:hypothetical protein